MIKTNPTSLDYSDPNPLESAEYSLTIITQPSQSVDGDVLGGHLVDLYQGKLDWHLYLHILDELENNDRSMVYVGSKDRCETWASVFSNMGIDVEVKEI